MMSDVTRRKYLEGGGALAASAFLAGCTGILGSKQNIRVATPVTGIEEFNGQFAEDTGIEYEQHQADASNVASRIIQESQAGKLSFDLRRGSDPKTTTAMYEEGVFRDVPDDIREQWPDRVRFNGKLIADWMGLKLTLLYNEDIMSDPPTTLAEVVSEFPGEYAVDTRDEFIWVALRERHGADRAEELVQELGDGAQWSESHYSPVKDVASGELSMALTYNKFKYYDEFSNVVAEQELSDLPKIVRQISSVILQGTDNLAAAKRYMEYSQENIQNFLQNTGRPDAYFDPSEVIGNDEFLIWDSEGLSDTDLDEETTKWQELTGLTDTGT